MSLKLLILLLLLVALILFEGDSRDLTSGLLISPLSSSGSVEVNPSALLIFEEN